MVKTAERAETTQVRKAVRELGDVLYKKPQPQWVSGIMVEFRGFCGI